MVGAAFLIATDTPTGSGIMPLGMLYTITHLASLSSMPVEWAIAAATGDAASKPALGPSLVLIDNLRANPNNTPCFTYQEQVVGTNTYVTDVAITLTVQTQKQDPLTRQYELQTKALLNVAPRNIFNVWQLASAGITSRIQPTPASVTSLLP